MLLDEAGKPLDNTLVIMDGQPEGGKQAEGLRANSEMSFTIRLQDRWLRAKLAGSQATLVQARIARTFSKTGHSFFWKTM